MNVIGVVVVSWRVCVAERTCMCVCSSSNDGCLLWMVTISPSISALLIFLVSMVSFG